MAAALKPMTVWTHGMAPNPFKVTITLEELGIPYETIDIQEPKGKEYLAICPNGRLPAIRDPNNDDLILWESGAIVEYIVEMYDKESKLTFTKGPEKWLLKQYLHFQMSGQGPYFGQTVWFRKYHSEDVPSAKKRYDEQMVRVFQVLDTILEGKQYLVGEKLTYADICFIPWNGLAKRYMPDLWEGHEVEKKYPNFVAWQNRLEQRPSVKKVYGDE